MNQPRTSFLLLLLFIFSNGVLLARESSSPLSSLTQVIFVDDQGHPAALDNHAYHLEDYVTQQAIPNNTIKLCLGEKLLLRCNDGSPGTYKIKNSDGSPMTFLEEAKAAYGYDWDIYWNVSPEGPYFLLTADQEGTASLDVYSYGLTSSSGDPPDHETWERDFLGEITVIVSGPNNEASEAMP